MCVCCWVSGLLRVIKYILRKCIFFLNGIKKMYRKDKIQFLINSHYGYLVIKGVVYLLGSMVGWFVFEFSLTKVVSFLCHHGWLLALVSSSSFGAQYLFFLFGSSSSSSSLLPAFSNWVDHISVSEVLNSAFLWLVKIMFLSIECQLNAFNSFCSQIA